MESNDKTLKEKIKEANILLQPVEILEETTLQDKVKERIEVRNIFAACFRKEQHKNIVLLQLLSRKKLHVEEGYFDNNKGSTHTNSEIKYSEMEISSNPLNNVSFVFSDTNYANDTHVVNISQEGDSYYEETFCILSLTPMSKVVHTNY